MKGHVTNSRLAVRSVYLLLWGACFLPFLQAYESVPSTVETGYVTSNDGVRLYYVKVGGSGRTVIVPGRLFMFSDFQQLAKDRTLISYDMRNRGRSDSVTDMSKISLQHDADDLEAVRAHFGIEKPDLIGFSYLGKIVVLYAIQHPNHVNRIVQIGPVARKLGTKFPEVLTAGDEDRVPDPAETKRMETLYNNGFAKDHPKKYCELEWKVEQRRMVGNPANASRIPSPCEMKNEWPTHLWLHFEPLLASDRALDIPNEAIAKVTSPVLTIHGRKDRNAPYGGGREWDMLLPNARIITIEGAAHMSWVEFPEVVFPSIALFLDGQWPEQAQPVKSLELPPSKAGRQRANDDDHASAAVQNSDPAWSPDGSKIAFMSNRDNDIEIYVMDADGSNQRRLNHAPGRDAHPSWSPDGSKIYFQSPRSDAQPQIYVMNADGAQQKRLTRNTGFTGVPHSSPDGKTILFQVNENPTLDPSHWQIYVMDTDGSHERNLSNNQANDQVPRWSKDGSKISFFSDIPGKDQIYVMNADGSHRVRMMNDSFNDHTPSWSHDEKRISFTSDRDGPWEIYAANSDGSHVLRLTNNAPGLGLVSWSPDDRQLLFSVPEGESRDIYVMNSDGTGVRKLTCGSRSCRR